MSPLRLAALLLVPLIAGCATDWPLIGRSASPVASTPAATPPPAAPGAEYLIGPADVLSISVLNHAELNRSVTVRPDGRFSFALIGEVPAAGLTPPQLQDSMETALSEYIEVVPGEVSVIVDSVHSYTVSVLGEVRLPGRFEFRNQVTVLDALAQAGGLTEFASGSDILILRNNHGRTEKIRFDYKRSTRFDKNEPRVLLLPGDVVVVP